MMAVKLSVICTKQENGAYVAVCPELAGCFTQGDTYEEAMENIRELAEITLKEELDEESRNELYNVQTKIFSELEIIV